MNKCDIGLVGLAVMGQNLVLNMERNGYKVAVFNRSYETTKKFIDDKCADKNIMPAETLKELVNSLEKPRKIMLMIKAGRPVDSVIEKLIPMLEENDIIIDGGNSFYKDTVKRAKTLEDNSMLYIGTGVSGGEEGALNGPSIMPGGHEKAWVQVKNILTDISAKVGVNEDIPCCDYIGTDGAGHYVKMVHNGIEYGDMQLICESFFMMKETLGYESNEIQSIFANWNNGKLDSYLMEITTNILGKIDSETNKPMVDIIMDRAGQKGTGKWTSQEALELGVSTPTITEAVFARAISAIKSERVEASKQLPSVAITFDGEKDEFINDVKNALYVSKICSYAQGFALLKAASDEHEWNIKLGDMALLWRGGCIIRAVFLDKIKQAFDENKDLANLLLAPYFKDSMKDSIMSLRKVVSIAALNGIPVPAFSSALAYYDSYRREVLPANLLQAQRDYFGAHTYERTDKDGWFHTEWLED